VAGGPNGGGNTIVGRLKGGGGVVVVGIGGGVVVGVGVTVTVVDGSSTRLRGTQV
jgi:hypothetical protein